MQYQQAKHLKPAEFKRFWGVKLETFKQMVEIVRQNEGHKKKTGRPGKISLEDQILMTLDYWREYRTYFHIGQSWGVTESTACRIIRKVENTLSQARVLTLPGKKCLYQTDSAINVVVIDVTETPIERPKKNKNNSLAAKIFKILADRYRNRRKRFGLRFNLIAGLYNYELRRSSVNEISNSYV